MRATATEPDLLELENRSIDAHVALGREAQVVGWRIDPNRLPATHPFMGEKLAGVAGKAKVRANGKWLSNRQPQRVDARRCSDSD